MAKTSWKSTLAGLALALALGLAQPQAQMPQDVQNIAAAAAVLAAAVLGVVGKDADKSGLPK